MFENKNKKPPKNPTKKKTVLFSALFLVYFHPFLYHTHGETERVEKERETGTHTRISFMLNFIELRRYTEMERDTKIMEQTQSKL